MPDIHRTALLPGSLSENFSWPTAGLNIHVTTRALKNKKKQMSSESTPHFTHPMKELMYYLAKDLLKLGALSRDEVLVEQYVRAIVGEESKAMGQAHALID